MKTSRKLLLTGTVGALIPLALYASDQVNGMYNFVDGEPILTEEVNENFQHLAGLINSTDNMAHISVDEATGNVGIGTTAPVTKLQLGYSSFTENGHSLAFSSQSDFQYFYGIGAAGPSGGEGVGIWGGTNSIVKTATNAHLFVKRGTGNVGIGTTSPQGKLQVASDVTGSGGYQDYGQITASGATDNKLGVTLGYDIGQDRGYVYARKVGEGGKDLVLGNDKMMIKGDTGNVGIGTSAPSAALDVVRSGTNDPIALFGSAGPTDEQALTVKNGSGGISLFAQGGNGTFLTGASQGDVGIRITAGDDFFIGQERVPLFTIRSGGNVGIGTTDPGEKLVISANPPIIRLTETDGISYHIENSGTNFYVRNAEDNSVKFLINADGNVGIGTTTPAYKLDVNGEIRSSKGVYVAGNISADDYLTNSDLRLKTDIAPLENASEGIACLEGVTYRWNAPEASQDLQIGLIAQEVERCFPEVVTPSSDGYKSVSYARLVAPLIENAKEQQSLNASQQLEITRLKADQSATRAELAATNARLAKLEALFNSRR